ncbi:dolichyl-phosphate-mannose--protein mannosyltransferase [uncultured Pseudokineococcus sp.]|uniref:dolichyl-phosphate-mannose--protein mannosyltransferase n=1 Tax=uncultured Pseudokineococcus sp. TaxID=1642928 RepID=UPI0026055662|nr:phospholipid carrier-dependent glycosyltransferase [uncultured Pseudokineococcus sp.]
MTTTPDAPPAGTSPARPSGAESEGAGAPPPASTSDGAPSLRERLVGRPPTDRLWGWVGPLAVTALAAVLRLWDLGRPHQLLFDETYYVKQAYSLLVAGYELRWPEGADEAFAAGTPSPLDTADFPVHPPVGKWVLALGQLLLGQDSSTGWRLGAALAGVVSVLLVARIARRLFSSTLLGTVAGLLLAVDGQHIVHSRTGLLDGVLTLWVLAAFGALLLDRDASRARLARAVTTLGPTGARLAGLGPWLLARPWRLVAAVCLGLAVGTKWSGLYAFVALGLMTVLWDAGARRAAGVRHWFAAGLLKDGVPAAAGMLVVALGVYLASWAGWFASTGAHLRQYAAERPDYLPWLPDALASLWRYHQEMYGFHVGLSSPHPYQASPESWLVQGRPTSFFYEAPTLGVDGCAVSACSRAITALGNPVVWWGGALAVVVLVGVWALRRDWRAGAVLAPLAGLYLPWFLYPERTVYTFYSVAFSPYVVLALVMVLGMVLGRPDAPPRRRRWGAAVAGAVVVAAVLAAAFFWPVWAAQVIPTEHWRWRMWFPSWI